MPLFYSVLGDGLLQQGEVGGRVHYIPGKAASLRPKVILPVKDTASHSGHWLKVYNESCSIVI